MSGGADPVTALLELMRLARIGPADCGAIVVDGGLHRFRVEGDKPGSRNGWYVLSQDYGVAGSWKSGVTCRWSKKTSTHMSRSERDAFDARVSQAKAEAQHQRELEQRRAAERAASLWSKAAPASTDHPYLQRKLVWPGNARQCGNLLVLKIEDIDGAIRSLQFIAADGTKKLLSGGGKRGNFIIVAGSLPAAVVLLAEGFATASTVATQFPGAVVLAAIDAGNLEPVARAVRGRYADAQIVIAADDDRLTPGNPGLTRARQAAASVCGELVRPHWPAGAPDDLSDFNDLLVLMEECHG